MSSTPAAACLSLEQSVARLTVFFQLEREILRHEAAWLAGIPYWDAKVKTSEHLLEDAEHGEALLHRLHELKAGAAEHKLTKGVEAFVREFASAGSGDEWLHGLYGALKPWLAAQFRAYLQDSDPLMDAPSHRAIRRIIGELDAQIAWWPAFAPQFSPWEQPDVQEWMAYVKALTACASVADGEVQGLDSGTSARPPNRSDFAVFPRVRRDRTFQCVAAFAGNQRKKEEMDFAERRFVVFYNHVQEMQFAESLGATLYETPEMPWAYHHDLARHVADEVRHSRMGKTRLEQLGHRFVDVPMLTENYVFRSNLEPLERFCLMTLVMEAGGFENARSNVKLFEEHRDEISTRYAMYDIRDEMLHANLGHVWVPILLRVYSDSRSMTDLVEHCRTLRATASSASATGTPGSSAPEY